MPIAAGPIAAESGRGVIRCTVERAAGAPVVALVVALGLGVGGLNAPAAAQPAGFAGAKRVDPTVSDLGPSSTSLRILQPGLGVQSAFVNLFEITPPIGERFFARFDGGVTAIFPRSAYVDTRLGELPLIPAGTQFVIGEPPAWLLEHYGLPGTPAAPGLGPSSAPGAGGASVGGPAGPGPIIRGRRIDIARLVDGVPQAVLLLPSPSSSRAGGDAALPGRGVVAAPGPISPTTGSIRDLLREAARAERGGGGGVGGGGGGGG